MRSDKQREASRRNGAKSTGPKTAEGKKTSALNSFKHGVYSDAILFSCEDSEGLEELRQAFHNRFQPRDIAEDAIIEELVHAQWRTQRMQILQTSTIELEVGPTTKKLKLNYGNLDESDYISAAVQGCLAKSPALNLFFNLELRYRRAFSRALRDLVRLRKEPELKTEGTNPSQEPNHSENEQHTPEQEPEKKPTTPEDSPLEPLVEEPAARAFDTPNDHHQPQGLQWLPVLRNALLIAIHPFRITLQPWKAFIRVQASRPVAQSRSINRFSADDAVAVSRQKLLDTNRHRIGHQTICHHLNVYDPSALE